MVNAVICFLAHKSRWHADRLVSPGSLLAWRQILAPAYHAQEALRHLAHTNTAAKDVETAALVDAHSRTSSSISSIISSSYLQFHSCNKALYIHNNKNKSSFFYKYYRFNRLFVMLLLFLHAFILFYTKWLLFDIKLNACANIIIYCLFSRVRREQERELKC